MTGDMNQIVDQHNEIAMLNEALRASGLEVERLRAERDDWKSRCLASAVLVTDPIVNAVAVVATAEAAKEEP